MPKLQCTCGYVHNLSPIPDEGWVTVRDKDYEALLDVEEQRRQLSEAEEGSEEWTALQAAADKAGGWEQLQAAGDKAVVDLSGLLYECPRCGRLMWKKRVGEGYVTYLPENRQS
jgi:hypothetical protein